MELTDLQKNNTERAARIVAILNLVAQKITLNEVLNQKEAENVVRSFTPIKNVNDERIAEIPINTVGKIIKHKEFDTSRILKSIPTLYESSLLAWSEPEIKRKGHKHHPNIKEYHHYINKFTDGNNEYYVRFTLHETCVKPGKISKNYIHSTAISNTNVYKKGDGSNCIRDTCTGKKNTSPFHDLRIMDFFNSVK